MDQAAKRYLTRLRRALVCSREDREHLLSDAGAMLENFAQENPGVFYKDYVDSFGPPESFAAEMLSNLDPEDVAEARTRRQRTVLGAVAAAGILLVLLTGFWFGRQSHGQPTMEASPTPTAETTPAPTPEPTAEPTPEPDTEGEESWLPGPSWEDSAAYLNSIYSDSQEITHRQAAAVLTRLGIISPKYSEVFYPTGTVTRAEVAKILALIMNGGEDFNSGTKEEPSFSDIWGHWAESYIEYCADLGIVSGGEDGQFKPGDPVTGLELIKMALCMLGYDAEAYSLNGPDWAEKTDELARYTDPSMYEGLWGIVINEPITRDNMIQIFYNAMHIVTKRVAPIQMVDGAVAWQYIDGTKPDGSHTDLLWDRFGMNWEDLSFD